MTALERTVRGLVAALERARAASGEEDVYDDAITLTRALLDDRDAHLVYSPLARYVSDSLPWTEEVIDAFERMQRALRAHRARRVPLERVARVRMSSGAEGLVLSKRVTRRRFGDYANAIVRVLRAAVEGRPRGPGKRVWSISVGGRSYRLAHDDERGVSIEPEGEMADDEALRRIQQALRSWRDS